MKKFLNVVLFVFLILWLIGKCSNEESTSKSNGVCIDCGKHYADDERSYYAEKGYYVYSSSNRCAKCELEESKKSDREWMKGEIKKARNKWVDNNPEEAKRRGINKF